MLKSISKQPPMVSLLYSGLLLPIIKILLILSIRNRADVNANDNDCQETTLHEMAHQGKLDIAKILLDNGANINEEDIKASLLYM